MVFRTDLIIYEDGRIEEPKDKLDKQDVIDRFGLLVRFSLPFLSRNRQPYSRCVFLLATPSSVNFTRTDASCPQPRDLRSIDAHILDVRPALIVASRSLIVCTPIIRAIIAADCIVLIGTDKDNPISTEGQSRQMAESIQRVMQYLEVSGSATGPKSSAPFELRCDSVTFPSRPASRSHLFQRRSALEALLLLTVRGLKDLSMRLQDRVYSTIPQLRFGVSPAELRDLLEVKRTVEDCLLGGRAMQSALAAVLADDEDLAHMYVSDSITGKVRSTADHQQAELLLEYCSSSCSRATSTGSPSTVYRRATT